MNKRYAAPAGSKMKVFVYRNLHTGLWSVKALDGEHKGRVIMHSKMVMVEDVELRVSEAGRQRVLREKRKNVHAGVVGNLLVAYLNAVRHRDARMDHSTRILPYNRGERLSYNPYKAPTFVMAVTGDPVTHAPAIILDGWGKVYEFKLS